MRGSKVVAAEGGLRWSPLDRAHGERCVDCARQATYAVSVDDPEDRVGRPLCAEHLWRLREARRGSGGPTAASQPRLFDGG